MKVFKNWVHARNWAEKRCEGLSVCCLALYALPYGRKEPTRILIEAYRCDWIVSEVKSEVKP